MKDIKESNINLVVPELDEFCTPESSLRIFYELGTQDKTIRYVRDNAGLAPDHQYFSQVTGERFIQELVNSMERDSEEDIPAMDALEVGNLFIAS